jgi:hydrophobe/amphiphile efflux-1 (HAE1) family protein
MVISIIITLAGLISLFNIPVAEFPQITPPAIRVSANYPGANAQVVSDSVASPLEEEINGVEDMLYMDSTSSDGSYNLTVTFAVGTDPDADMVNLQNRIQMAMSKLPREVVDQGIRVRKRTSNILAAVSFFSPGGSQDNLFLSNFVSRDIKNAIVRIKGVSDVFIFGELEYSMRVWLDPSKLTSLGLTADDVIDAIKRQNIQAAVGSTGTAPMDGGQQLQYTLRAQGRLKDVEDFKDIIVRANGNGGLVRIRDVTRVELGARSYSNLSSLNSAPTVTIAVYRSADANSLETMRDLRAELTRLEKNLPEDVNYRVILDETKYTRASIHEIEFTLLITFFLVVVVIYLFLQDWRASLIPILAVPVSLIGTFSVLLVLGFTANTISLFALVLAIGVVVDDAIVVVENSFRVMEEENLGPKEAAGKAMGQVTGPIIATTLVLLAVFAPAAFVPGISGKLYRQFAVTVCTSVVISAVNALTLSPALCAILLKPGSTRTKRGPLSWFNRALSSSRKGYVTASGWLIRRIIVPVSILGVVIGCAYLLFQHTPRSFLPKEDIGYFYFNIQLPEGATLSRTAKVMEQITDELTGMESVQDVIAVSGRSFLSGVGENVGLGVVLLSPWDERKDKELHLEAVLGRVRKRLGAISSANILAFVRPPIRGLGFTSGFDYRLQALGEKSPQELAAAARALVVAANQDPDLTGVFTTYTADTPQILVNLDRTRAETLNVPVERVFSTLQAQLGSKYVNDFNLYNRVYQVKVQAEASHRKNEEDIMNLFVRSENGNMVPLRGLLTMSTVLGPSIIYRYNQFPSVRINGSAAEGLSSGDGMAAMERLSQKTLPEGFTYDWSAMSYQEKKIMGQVSTLFLLALVFGYLFLVGQYESWTLPLPIILSIPVATLGALIGLRMAGLPLSIYAQIGIVLLVGLASKNAILIVEFARDQRKAGVPIDQAAIDGARIRFRPVLMTAFTFILGVSPMVIATGTGAASRRHIGTTVFSGMLAATLVGIFLVPALYYVFQHLGEKRGERLARLTGSVKSSVKGYITRRNAHGSRDN